MDRFVSPCPEPVHRMSVSSLHLPNRCAAAASPVVAPRAQAPSSETLRRLETVEAPVAAAATGEALGCDEAEQRNADRVAMIAGRLLHVVLWQMHLQG